MVGIRDIPGRFLCLVGLKSPVFSTILLTPGQGVSSPLMLDSGQVNRLQPARQEIVEGEQHTTATQKVKQDSRISIALAMVVKPHWPMISFWLRLRMTPKHYITLSSAAARDHESEQTHITTHRSRALPLGSLRGIKYNYRHRTSKFI